MTLFEATKSASCVSFARRPSEEEAAAGVGAGACDAAACGGAAGVAASGAGAAAESAMPAVGGAALYGRPAAGAKHADDFHARHTS